MSTSTVLSPRRSRVPPRRWVFCEGRVGGADAGEDRWTLASSWPVNHSGWEVYDCNREIFEVRIGRCCIPMKCQARVPSPLRNFGGCRDSCDDKGARYFSLSPSFRNTHSYLIINPFSPLPLIYTFSHAKKATDNHKHGTPVTPTLRPRLRRCGLGLAPGPFELAASPQMGMWSSCYDVGRCAVALGPGSRLRRGGRMPFLLRPLGLPARW